MFLYHQIIKIIITDKVRKHKEHRTTKAIESALQIKLTNMQKQYIFGHSEWILTGRRTGKTTAYCIKQCISKGDAIVIRFGMMPSQYLDGLNTVWYNRCFTSEFIQIYKALSKTNIKLRKVKIENAGRSKSIRYEEIKKSLADIKSNHAENLADVLDYFICSCCDIRIEAFTRVKIDEDSQDISFHEYDFKFCPECGADMREQKNDNG